VPLLRLPCCVGQTPTDKEWFQGTADAVRQYAWLLTDTKNRNIEDVVILSGDHL
jgi:glucose-1-phosphate adenylyltransferase